MDSETVHRSDGTTIRRLSSGAVSYEWEIVDPDQEDSVEGYEYLGDDDPSETAVDVLEDWIDEHHDVDESDG